MPEEVLNEEVVTPLLNATEDKPLEEVAPYIVTDEEGTSPLQEDMTAIQENAKELKTQITDVNDKTDSLIQQNENLLNSIEGIEIPQNMDYSEKLNEIILNQNKLYDSLNSAYDLGTTVFIGMAGLLICYIIYKIILPLLR